jgi:hypothetical protein
MAGAFGPACAARRIQNHGGPNCGRNGRSCVISAGGQRTRDIDLRDRGSNARRVRAGAIDEQRLHAGLGHDLLVAERREIEVHGYKRAADRQAGQCRDRHKRAVGEQKADWSLWRNERINP